MIKRKPGRRYDYNFLIKHCTENEITLKKDYTDVKVNRDTIIEAKCLNCDEVCIRNFRQFITGAGCFCKIHTNENKREKTIATCLKNHGVEHPSQSEEIRDKMKATNKERYGCENPLQNDDIKDKIKATNIERYGVEHPSQSEEIKDKKKQLV